MSIAIVAYDEQQVAACLSSEIVYRIFKIIKI